MKKDQIRIEVWSDYVCPFCYLQEPVLQRIANEYQGRVTLQWRAFELRPEPVPTPDPDSEYLHAIWNRAVYPMAHMRGMKLRLPPIQPRSRRAFEAAEFARAHGRFAEMHEGLFCAFFQEGLDLGSLPVLLQVAAGAGLDPDDLRSALEKNRYASKIVQDEELAYEIGISGVPTIVLSQPGRNPQIECTLAGAQPFDILQSAVERCLNGQPSDIADHRFQALKGASPSYRY